MSSYSFKLQPVQVLAFLSTVSKGEWLAQKWEEPVATETLVSINHGIPYTHHTPLGHTHTTHSKMSTQLHSAKTVWMDGR